MEDNSNQPESSNEDHRMETIDGEGESLGSVDEEIPKRKRKPGIVYLSSIPIGMNPQLVREFLGAYGEIGKSYLQPVNKTGKRKKTGYSEGWIEFKSKRIAKLVAERLNNTKVGGKKRSKYHDSLWTIKYLPRFKWAHLNERLAYEKAVRQQRMQTEIAQVKRETNFFIESIEKSNRIRRKPVQSDGWNVTQKSTEEEIMKSKEPTVKRDRTQFLKNLFQPNSE